ncbi:PREDICTED: poly [ADP-ribose] polymerase 11-like [Cyprinodon variegatus]|uniref:poly [ADP-ribose] polymerase 11-like n=1 Tax=Cyprinodon variegatus TaxID=28743 RepID=UPI0007426233|nr:PREDICTED: poly [ADP-ribose] polymerase 11-like [Cyprinodon variegatus]
MSSLGEVEDMDTWDTPWYWYYLEDCGRWHRFEDEPSNPVRSEDIEKYYLMDPKSSFYLNSGSYKIKIDFSGMLQTDLTTGRQRRIQRHNLEKCCSCSCSPPIFWEQFNPMVPYQLIPLSKLTPEYKTVASYTTNEGRLSSSIVSISRIQNLDLWEIFCRKKKQLMRIQNVTEIPERRLFHGTDTKNVDSICKYNFDLRIPKINGRSYGNGIYFAVEALYAGRYSSNSTTSQHNGNTKPIFLARVLVGKFKLGRSSMQKPDDENQYLSCVNDINHPKIFVIFDPNQIYPEYLIEYQ